jgi:NitT/TauT family transport system substrate-binding protein
MKRCKLFLVLLTGILLSACGSVNLPQATLSPGGLTHVRLPMGYIPNVQYAPFYVAVDKGYFAEAGFEVEFDYSFETDGVQLVGAGEAPFALASGEQILLARAQEIPVVYVMGWFQDFPVAVAAKVESGIQTPADLVGKKIGIPMLSGASYIGLRALMYESGIAEEDITLDSIGFNQVEALAADQEEAVVVYVTNEPVQLRAQGYDVNVIRVADYSHLAANGIITNETTIAEDPEMVQRFVGAALRGLADTIDDPEGAYAICEKYVEGLAEENRAVQMEVLNLSIDFWRADRLGYSQAAAWENMQAVLLDMGLLTKPLDLNAAYTNDFIE